MCVQPIILAPERGLSASALLLNAITPGISMKKHEKKNK
jgi:hypothetical protein